MAGSWNHLKACSLVCLVVSAGCWQWSGPVLSARKNTYMWVLWTAWLSHSMVAGFQDRASQDSKAKLHGIFNLVLKLLFFIFLILKVIQTMWGVTLFSSVGLSCKGPPRFRGGIEHRPLPLEGRTVNITHKKSIWDGIYHCSHFGRV